MKSIMPKKLFKKFGLFFLLPLMLLVSCTKDIEEIQQAESPSLISLSDDVTTSHNKSVTLQIDAEVHDGGRLVYEWFVSDKKLEDGESIQTDDESKNELSPDVSQSGTKYYYCQVTNLLGESRKSINSPRISVTVLDSVNAKSPVIINQPKNINLSYCEDFSFELAAYSPDGGTISYQWYFSDSNDDAAVFTPIENATEAKLSGIVSESSVGNYYCEIVNTISDNGDGGAKSASIKSNTVILSNGTVNANQPVINSQPANVQAVIPASATFSVGASSVDGGSLSYQWYSKSSEESEGVKIDGATDSVYTVSYDSEVKIGYYCIITNTIEDNGDGGIKAASVTSQTAWFEAAYLKNVISKPTVKRQVQTVMVLPKSKSYDLTFEATADQGTVLYQWYESPDGTMTNGIKIEGATESTYTVPAFEEMGIRYFYCTAISDFCKANGLSEDAAGVKSDVAAVAYTGLPLINIKTEDRALPTPSKEKHNGRMKITYPDGKEYDSGESKDFSIKVRGNATAWYPKSPYKLKIPKKKNLIDIDSSENKDKNWVLLAGYCDKTLLRNKIGFWTADLFNQIEGNENLYTPHSEFVDLVINGEYLGNYTLCDSVKENPDRCTVNEKDTDEGGIGFVAEMDGGYYANEPKWFKTINRNNPYTFKFPDTDDINFDSYMACFENYMNNFETALYDNPDSNDWQNYIDIESFARWFLAHNLLANIDVNYFFTKKDSTSSKLVMGPVWDFEWSVGIGWYDGVRPRPADYWCVNGWYFEELLKKDAFKTELKNQWEKVKELCGGGASNVASAINTEMDSMADEISISQKANFMRWPILNSKVSVGGIPLGSYQAELECDKAFIESRMQWLETAIGEL